MFLVFLNQDALAGREQLADAPRCLIPWLNLSECETSNPDAVLFLRHKCPKTRREPGSTQYPKTAFCMTNRLLTHSGTQPEASSYWSLFDFASIKVILATDWTLTL